MVRDAAEAQPGFELGDERGPDVGVGGRRAAEHGELVGDVGGGHVFSWSGRNGGEGSWRVALGASVCLLVRIDREVVVGG